ncbi:unnamed protein product, partial [Rotaria sp. Silwood1]
MFQIDKSSVLLSNVTTTDATTIPFFDETQQNPANVDSNNHPISGFSNLLEQNQKDNDLIITLDQAKSY